MKQFRKLVGPYCFWLFVLTVVPMLLIMIYAFVQKGNTITTFNFTLENFSKFFDPIFVSVLVKSFVLGAITTVLCLAIGYPVAYAISRCKEKTQTLLILLITFPTWINMLMRTYAWINILSSKGIISNFVQFLGFGEVSFLYTDFAVVLGMVYDFLPFMILPIYTVLVKMDTDLINAASDLGATKSTIFRKIIFPLSMPGVISGITMVFMPAVSTFVISRILGGGQYMLLGNLIQTQYTTMGDWNFGSAIAIFMMIIILISMAFMNKFEGSDDKEGGSRLW